MEAQTETQTQAETPTKTSIRPDVSKMVKTAGGSYHKDDAIGHSLNGLTIDQVKIIAAELGLDANKYDHLNVGQQRMNLGNGLRRLSADAEKANQIEELAAPMREANVAAKEAAAAEKAAAKEAADAEKAAKPKKQKKAKIVDSAEGEGSQPE